MLNKKYLLISLFLIIITTIIFVFIKPKDKIETTVSAPVDTVSRGGWVEIFSGKAEVINKLNVTKELLSGDIVGEGDEIIVSDNGNISIHLFDGSVLRASDGAKFSIKNAEYDKASGRLLLDANLSNGKIWSKIIELATPDSLWKIETSNTVATVRGSAFGVSTNGVNSEIFGSQHNIYVDLVDPHSKKKVNNEPILIEEDSFLIVSVEDIERIKKLEEQISSATSTEVVSKIKRDFENLLIPRKKSEKLQKNKWINDNETEDSYIEKEVREIKENTKNKKEEFKKTLNKKVEEKLKELKNKKNNQLEKREVKFIDGDTSKVQKVPEKLNGVFQRQNTVQAPQEIARDDNAVINNWNKLTIETFGDIGNIAEGQMVSFRAILRGENNTEKDVTMESKWQALGKIGFMNRPGTFTAKLDPSIAEYGEGFGFITAIWQGKNDEQFLGKTDEVRVFIKADDAPIPEEILLTQ